MPFQSLRQVALAAVLLASFIQAQSSLSQNCSTTLAAVATEPDVAACLRPSSLLPVFAGPGNASIVKPLNTWISDFCAAPACSNKTIDSAAANITSGCATDLSALGISSSFDAQLVDLVQQSYPTFRKVLCLKDGNVNCVNQTLTNIEGAAGPLTFGRIISLIKNPNITLFADVTCTACNKAFYSIINGADPAVITDTAPSLQAQCGASFTDGQIPPTIDQSAANASSSDSHESFSAGWMSTNISIAAILVALISLNFL